MLLIIHNQNSYIKRYEREVLKESGLDYTFVEHNQPIQVQSDKKVKGIILSGGRGNPYKSLNLTANYVALNNFDVPVIGFCLSHEIIAVYFGGHIDKLDTPQRGKKMIRILKSMDPIFSGVNKKEIKLQKLHWWHVSKIPSEFEVLASSDATPHEVIRHKHKPIYGFQGHPEVSGEVGMTIMNNFLKICKL